MDSPWNATFRQRLARLKIGRFIDRLDAIFVPGERAAIFASRLRMPQSRIFRGMYGFDYRHFAPALAQRLSAGPWPRSFLYMGRYVPQKGLDVLTAGYDQYRKSIADPWPLVCHGTGPAKGVLEGRDGVTVNDWAQPADQPSLLARHGAFILTSHAEPWGVAVAEAMASGLPAICSDRVGAVPDLIRPGENGLIIPTNDPAALAAAMRWMHDHHDHLREMGRAAREAAETFSAQNWADRFEAMAAALRELPPRR
jgi:glycosyltransferase involved in cell wall biosynthesis